MKPLKYPGVHIKHDTRVLSLTASAVLPPSLLVFNYNVALLGVILETSRGLALTIFKIYFGS